MSTSPESFEKTKSPAVTLIERELGGLALNEVEPQEVVVATKRVMEQLAERNDTPEGFSAEDYDLLERVACVRGVYESMANTKQLIDGFKSRLDGVPLPVFANENGAERSVAA